MANDIESTMIEIEQAVIAAATAAQVRHCVKDTSNLVQAYPETTLVNGFEQRAPWFMFNVSIGPRRKITVGSSGHSRNSGSIEFNLYAPAGQGNRGIAKLVDFVHDHFHATNIGNIRIRDARPIAEYDVSGWKIQTLQVTFERNVS